MTIRHLEIFMAVCRHMSMTEAARELNMSQPAVSRAVSELEDFYHVSLFDRLNRKIQLTDAGQALLEYANTILSQYEESISYLRDASSFQDCRLCVNETAGETILAELIREIHKRVPQARLHAGVYSSETIEKMMRNNECDLAIMDETSDPAFDVIELYSEETGFFASSRYCAKERLSTGELREYRLLISEKGSVRRMNIDLFLKQIRYPETDLWESVSDEAIASLARNGLGIAVLPVSYAGNAKGLHRITIDGENLKQKICLTALHAKYLNSAVQECAKVIHEYCRSHAR